MLAPNVPVSYITLYFQGIFPGPGEYRVSLVVNGVEYYSTSVAIDQAAPGTFN